jgi:hypothetical protein
MSLASSPAAIPIGHRVRFSSKTILEYSLVGLALFALVLMLQWSSGAYLGDYGNHPDEAAHFVSALLIHDYLREGFPGGAMQYAEAYYLHYPKVAVGMWPPAFHIGLALWMLIFGVSHSSALAFLAFLSALLAAGVYAALCQTYGRVFALTSAGLLAGTNLMRENTSMIMADVLVAVFALGCIVSLSRFLDSGKTRDAVLYGATVTLACMTKANGIAFIVAAPIALLVSRRLHLLRRPGLYWAAAIFVVFGLPWQIHSYLLIEQNMLPHATSIGKFSSAIAAYGRLLWNTVGPGVGILVVLGILAALARRRMRALEVCAASSVIAVIGYHAAIGVDPRYLLTALPPLFLLLPQGMEAAILPMRRRVEAGIVVAALVVLISVTTAPSRPMRTALGYERAAELVRARAPGAEVALISADALGEGAFVAAMADIGPRPRHFVLRGTKLAAEITWYGGNYRLLYKNAADMQQALTKVPIDILVLDESGPRPFPHQQVIGQMIRDFSDQWELLGRISPDGAGGCSRTISVYRLRGVPANPKRHFELQMRYVLNKNLRLGQ